MLPAEISSRGTTSRWHPPLRTVQASFPTHGSSIWLRSNAASEMFLLATQLPVYPEVWIEGGGSTFHFYPATNLEEIVLEQPAFPVIKLPFAGTDTICEIVLCYPLKRLLRVSTLGPFIDHGPDSVVDCGKRAFGDDVTIVKRPTPYNEVEVRDHRYGPELPIASQVGGNLSQMIQDLFLLRFHQHLPGHRSDVEAEEVKALADMDQLGLCFAQFQSSFS